MLTTKEIVENHKRYLERIEIYRKRGLNTIESRRFILKVAGPLRDRILEVGVGRGYTTLALVKAGYKLIGIDIDREMIETASLNLAYEGLLSKTKFFMMNAESLAFKDSSFDTIIAVDVLHHLKEPKQILFEMNRVLKRSGKLILADLNERGRKIVDSVHKEEGRSHTFSTNREYIYEVINSMGYKTRDYEDNCYWILVSEKL
jgi:ubiquinone/menaquinone biosynthesis C-methylase UbiE